jgi:two-component system cell cycle response regulator
MQKGLLLIVDDWEALEVYEDRLKNYFRIYSAAFGSEGIRLAQELPVDRILIDLTFEDMDAAEACEKLRTHPKTKGIPLTVIVSEDEKAFEKAEMFPLPADQFYRRPFPFEQLLQALNK